MFTVFIYIFWYFFIWKARLLSTKNIIVILSQHVPQIFDQDGNVPYPIILEIWLLSKRTIRTSTNHYFERLINEKYINAHVGALYWVLKCVTFMTITGLHRNDKILHNHNHNVLLFRRIFESDETILYYLNYLLPTIILASFQVYINLLDLFMSKNV